MKTKAKYTLDEDMNKGELIIQLAKLAGGIIIIIELWLILNKCQ